VSKRFYSLDVFRGATVALMILVNNPGSWEHTYAPLEHAAWHGCTPTDLVFPFFLFAVGNALAFVMPKLEAAGVKLFWKKVLKRTFLIFFIGLFLNWFPFIKWHDDHLVFKPWQYIDDTGKVAGVRILGVLQRIALAYFFASVIIYFLKIRGAFVVSFIILFGYWLLCIAANYADPFSLQGWFGTAIDRNILSDAHMYHGEIVNGHRVVFDPEGFMSLFGAIVQVMFGYFVGDYIFKKGKTPEMVNGLFVAGCVLVFSGYCWDMVFPINKKIWTSSYTVYTSGLAMLILGVLIYIIEFRNWKGWWSRFFDVFGKNPLFIFVLSGVFPRALGLIRISNGLSSVGKPIYLSPFGWFYEYVCKPISSNLNIGSLFYAICMILFYWLIVWWMDKRKIYVKV
jgi:predicted acyltransferase